MVVVVAVVVVADVVVVSDVSEKLFLLFVRSKIVSDTCLRCNWYYQQHYQRDYYGRQATDEKC